VDASRIRAAAKRSKLVAVPYYVLTNLRGRRGFRAEAMAQSSGQPVAEAVEYVESSFAAMLDHAGLCEADLVGARVLELGPGDNLGLALRFLAAGAGEVVALDRFVIPRDPDHEAAIYRGLLDRLPAEARERADPGRIRNLTGLSIEEAPCELEPASFDVILSIAVLEHVFDPDAALRAMDALLRTGGRLLHQIDFRDHGMFSAGGSHPLTFLTLSPRVWALMTSNTGRPNRHLVGWWRERLAERGYEVRMRVNHLIGHDDPVEPCEPQRGDSVAGPRQRELIEQIRPRLHSVYRGLPDDELAAAGAFMVARKH
jgi:SAM-dependent methyltransferase